MTTVKSAQGWFLCTLLSSHLHLHLHLLHYYRHPLYFNHTLPYSNLILRPQNCRHHRQHPRPPHQPPAHPRRSRSLSARHFSTTKSCASTNLSFRSISSSASC